MQPAARFGDVHACPQVDVLVPHVGGPIVGCCPNVFIGGLPAARMGDVMPCATVPDSIAMGNPLVLIGGMPAARMGDPSGHGGAISIGCPTVFI